MWPTHRVRPRAKVKTICLEAVKMKGNNPRKLFNRMNIKRETKTHVVPGVARVPNTLAISKWSSFKSICQKSALLLLSSHKFAGITPKNRAAEAQFKGNLIIAAGSNALNKLVIRNQKIVWYPLKNSPKERPKISILKAWEQYGEYGGSCALKCAYYPQIF